MTEVLRIGDKAEAGIPEVTAPSLTIGQGTAPQPPSDTQAGDDSDTDSTCNESQR